MKNNFVNLSPDINWEKEDVVLYTSSGVVHSAKPEKKLSTHYVTVEQQWNPMGYYIQDCGDYLALYCFHIESSMSRVGDYKDAVERGEIPHLVPYNALWRGLRLHARAQLRIYKDRSYTLLRQVTIQNNTITYIHTDEHESIVWDEDDLHSETNQVILNGEAIKIIHNDVEAKRNRRHVTKKAIPSILQLFPANADDLRSRRLHDYSGYWYDLGKFTDETQTLVENFLDIHNDEYQYLRFNYQKATGGDDVTTIQRLLVWCQSRIKAPKITQTKEEKAEEILRPVMYEWAHPDEFVNQAIWFRSGVYVALIIPHNEQESRWGYGHGCRKLFAYNTETKKRFYGECDSNNNWTFPVPSLSYIRQAMWLGDRTEYHGYGQENTVSRVDTLIKGDIDIKTLFEGTNIAWILDNVDNTYQIIDQESDTHRYSSDEQTPIALLQLLDKKRIGTVALNILISTGLPVLEQLLKSRLFNLYFVELDSLSESGCGYSTEVLWDLDKKRNYDYGKENALLTYHSKAKNLKKMFGLNINMLRIIDDKMKIQYGKPKHSYYSDDTDRYYRQSLSLVGLDTVIGTSVANLDPKTFEKCVELSSGSNSRYSHNIWSAFRGLVTENSNMTPKQIIQYIDDYKDCSEELTDYLNMRHQLAQIQSVKPDIPDIFNEKRYPMRPTAAKRFIPYLNGMVSNYRWRREEFLTPEEFYREYRDRYCQADERGDLLVAKDDNGNIVGLMIHMTPAENLKFLHDDASYWVDFYQDEAKNDLFAKAIERVKKYEWKDKKLGLEIIAPTCIQDVKEEGHVLSHCVASYVDPIINGRENIMFLRRSDMPSHPFFTVEVVDGGEIRQVHCYQNGNPTDEDQRKAYTNSGYEVYNKVFPIVEFLQHWAKAGKGIKSSTIHNTYGALCAKYR